MKLPADREGRDRLTASLPVEIGADFFIRRRKVLDLLTAFLRDEGVLAPESYARLVRMVGKSVPVRMALDVAVKFHDDALAGLNVIAEIPGGRKKDEIVMLGAHLDSWHGGTGATDNAAG